MEFSYNHSYGMGRNPFLDDLSSQGVFVVDSSSTPGKLYMMRSVDAKESNLDRLNLSRRKLVSIPVFKGEEHLKLLNLQENLISRIEHLGSLPSLIFLDLYHNQIKEIHNLEFLQNLRVLMLGRNLVKKIECLENLHLDVLDLHSNQIERIENMSHMTELRVLNLAGNLLRRVNGLHALTNLVDLNLRRNLIESMSGIEHLVNIQRLFLSSNRLATFVDVSPIFYLTKMTDLSLDDNPVSNFQNYAELLRKALPMLKMLDGKQIDLYDNLIGHESFIQMPELSQLIPPRLITPPQHNEALVEVIPRHEDSLPQSFTKSRSSTDDFTLYSTPKEKGRDSASKSLMGSGDKKSQENTPDGVYITPLNIETIDCIRGIQTDCVVVRNVNFNDFIKVIPRLLKKMPKINHLHLFHNNLKSLKQLHSLVPLELRELRIIDNPINYLMLFESYATLRLTTLMKLNGKEISSSMRKLSEQMFSSFEKMNRPKGGYPHDEESQKQIHTLITNPEQEHKRVLSQSEIDECQNFSRRIIQSISEKENRRGCALGAWDFQLSDYTLDRLSESVCNRGIREQYTSQLLLDMELDVIEENS